MSGLTDLKGFEYKRSKADGTVKYTYIDEDGKK